ncbi:hypothetical protein CFB47_12185 [Burkholderia sp. AU27893]|uniref:Uncharacterized protein n=1 Tax=Burkholderia contaminans TaxID=488447 RepID=A0A2S5DTU4_9BURK|nr:hypothetical protein CFB47_12185 [Burkholderia sp. AU27893]POZ82519.1 hypothetical protein C3743_20080 [Burkholderia contaminans]
MPLAAACADFDAGAVTRASWLCATSCGAACVSNARNGSSTSGNVALLHRDTLPDDRRVPAHDLLTLAIHVHAVD